MRLNYTILLILLAFGHLIFAQNDTLYHEDFSDSTLSNWTLIDSNNMNFNWIWSNSAPGGMYSTQIGPINSPTSSNGFLCLPADLYNTPMPGSPVPMNAWIISDPIPISPKAAVDLSYRQHLRYCCGRTNPMEVQVSSDSVNWTAFDAKLGRSASLPGPDGELITFNLNSVLGNEDTAYIRFRMTGDSHYFWMIDDLTLTEGIANAMKLDSAIFDPFSASNSKLNYSILPAGFGCLKSFNAIAKNVGIYTQRNVRMKAMVYMDSTISGAAGQGLVQTIYSDTSTILPTERKEIEIVNNAPYNSGHYKAILSLESDSILQNLQLAKDTIYFSLTADTVIARDYGQFNSSLGPKLNGPGHNGDKIGILLEGQDSSLVSSTINVISLSVYVSSDTNNIGVSISPRIWIYNGSSIDSIPIGGSPFSIQIQSHMLDSWLTLPIFPPINLPPSELVFGLEQTANLTANSGFSLGVDAIGSQFARDAPTFISSNHTSLAWATHPGLVGIRLNISALSYPCSTTVGIEEEDSSSNTTLVYPNPSNGILSIQGIFYSQELEVRDINGRLVYSRRLQKGESTIDLSYLHNGLYFLHFKGEEELVKKLLIQK